MDEWMETKGVYFGEGNAGFVLNNEPLVGKGGKKSLLPLNFKAVGKVSLAVMSQSERGDCGS